MPTQADELRELIREANGVRGDLERQVKEAKKVGKALADEVRVEIEESLAATYDAGRRQITEALNAALIFVRDEVGGLYEILIGKRPMPKEVRKAAGGYDASIPSNYKNRPAFYADIETIINHWNSLDDEALGILKSLLSTAASMTDGTSKPIVITTSQIAKLPEEIHQALRTFRSV